LFYLGINCSKICTELHSFHEISCIFIAFDIHSETISNISFQRTTKISSSL
jgi:hypothetical protein